jgi:hypothetical protein
MVIGLIILCGFLFNLWPVEEFNINDYQEKTPGEIAVLLLEMINKERLQRSIPAIVMNETLIKVAAGHSEKMIQENKLSHIFLGYPLLEDRLRDANIFFNCYSENIAVSETYYAKLIHEEFMNSPAHRANILNPDFNSAGIAVIKYKEKYYVTQNFAGLFEPVNLKNYSLELTMKIDNWLSEKYQLQPVHFVEIQKKAKELGLLMLLEIKLEELDKHIPEKWGAHRLYAATGTDLKEIEKVLKTGLLQKKYRCYAFDIQFSRNREYPGGFYSILFILFEDLSVHLNKKKIKESLKEKYESKEWCKKKLSYVKKSDEVSDTIAEYFYSNKKKEAEKLILQTGYLFFSGIYFQGEFASDNIIHFLINQKKKYRYFNIGLYYPLANGQIGNYIITTYLFW